MINILFNMLFGLSIGLIFSSIIITKQEFHGPNSSKFRTKIFTNKDGCFIYEPIYVECNSKYKHL